ncbi:hypothetical protein CDL17_12300 [Salmonella enterica subsp. enterica serovar Heidelberg]|uniref:helix-turn-helix domain-containing protein n=1 Tax=Salmonella enterica TaxID=28901 RepID=UPI000BA3DC4C|nr:helix-turn-helix domain-containing protein [Salmonella enterica]PAC07842.1 hypothetical protein CDL17_12300 [Salmonella enterica subsp. enterica serovar Heidelberg]
MEPKSQDWHRADIKSALEKRGITLRDLSRQAGLSPDSLRNVYGDMQIKNDADIAE